MLMIARNEQDEQHLMEKLDFGLLSELVIEELQTKAQEKILRSPLQKGRLIYERRPDIDFCV